MRKYHVSPQTPSHPPPPPPPLTLFAPWAYVMVEGRGVTICQEVCADSRGLYSGHYQCLDILRLIIIQVHSKHTHTHRHSTHTHTFNSEGSLAQCKLDREKEYDNKQPYVHGTRNNIWGFLCCLIFAPSALFSTSLGIMEVFVFKARTPPSILQLGLLPLRGGVCLWECARRAHPFLCVCV